MNLVNQMIQEFDLTSPSAADVLKVENTSLYLIEKMRPEALGKFGHKAQVLLSLPPAERRRIANLEQSHKTAALQSIIREVDTKWLQN
jgi:hypothetical protein